MIEDLVIDLIGEVPKGYEYIQYTFEGLIMLIVILGVVFGVVLFFYSFATIFRIGD